MTKGRKKMTTKETKASDEQKPDVVEKYATPLNPVEQIPKTHFIPHRDDPFLSLREAGRLIGRTHTTIGRWIDDGLIEAVKDGRGCRRIRTSELIRFSGVTAFYRRSPFLWVQESQLHPDYLPQADYPKPRTIDGIKYHPVPAEEVERWQNCDSSE